MPISKPSASSMQASSALLAAGLATSLMFAFTYTVMASAQETRPDTTAGSPQNSGPAPQALSQAEPKSGIRVLQQQGDGAMERLKGAIAKRKTDAVTGPATLPVPTEIQRRRAFEAMRAHMTSPAMEARAKFALDAGKDAFAAQRETMAKRLRAVLGLDAPDMAAVADAAAPKAFKAWVPVLFVSSSMPVATLRHYAGQLEKTGGVMAFRGMPGGLTRVAPMAKLSAEILRIDPGCEGPACAMRNVQIIVDPLVFRQHGVSAVPALAMIAGDPAQPYCERDETSPPESQTGSAAHTVYGDAALSGLLEEYARLGGKEEVRDAEARLQSR